MNNYKVGYLMNYNVYLMMISVVFIAGCGGYRDQQVETYKKPLISGKTNDLMKDNKISDSDVFEVEPLYHMRWLIQMGQKHDYKNEPLKQKKLRLVAELNVKYSMPFEEESFEEQCAKQAITAQIFERLPEAISKVDIKMYADYFVNLMNKIFNENDVDILYDFYKSLAGKQYCLIPYKVNNFFEHVTQEELVKKIKMNRPDTQRYRERMHLLRIMYDQQQAIHLVKLAKLNPLEKVEQTDVEMVETLSSVNYHKIVLDALDEFLTDFDVKNITKFLESSTGKKYLEHYYEIMREMYALISDVERIASSGLFMEIEYKKDQAEGKLQKQQKAEMGLEELAEAIKKDFR